MKEYHDMLWNAGKNTTPRKTVFDIWDYDSEMIDIIIMDLMKWTYWETLMTPRRIAYMLMRKQEIDNEYQKHEMEAAKRRGQTNYKK